MTLGKQDDLPDILDTESSVTNNDKQTTMPTKKKTVSPVKKRRADLVIKLVGSGIN